MYLGQEMYDLITCT